MLSFSFKRMSARDWDKLRRQQKAGKPSIHFRRKLHLGLHQPTTYELASGLYPGGRGRKPHRPKPTFIVASPTQSKPIKPAASRRLAYWLVVQIGDSFATAVFVRKSFDSPFRCTGTDHPAISWFTGCLHLQVIKDWLGKQRLNFRWCSNNPTRTVGTASQPPTEEPPAPSMKGHNPSAAQAHNTGSSLNNKNPSVTCARCAYVSDGLAQTGVSTSLLLNTSGLIGHPADPPRTHSQAPAV